MIVLRFGAVHSSLPLFLFFFFFFFIMSLNYAIAFYGSVA